MNKIKLKYSKGLERFSSLLPFNSPVVDISQGHGLYAALFKKNGHKVTLVYDDDQHQFPIDGQLEVITRAINSVIMPFRTIGGIWAEKALLNLPADKLKVLLGQFIDWLQVGGLIYFVLPDGEGYKLVTEQGMAGQKQNLIVYYNPQQIEEILADLQYQPVDAWYQLESDRRWIHLIAKRVV